MKTSIIFDVVSGKSFITSTPMELNVKRCANKRENKILFVNHCAAKRNKVLCAQNSTSTILRSILQKCRECVFPMRSGSIAVCWCVRLVPFRNQNFQLYCRENSFDFSRFSLHNTYCQLLDAAAFSYFGHTIRQSLTQIVVVH